MIEKVKRDHRRLMLDTIKERTENKKTFKKEVYFYEDNKKEDLDKGWRKTMEGDK